LRIESGAAGCEKLVRRVRLVAGQERVDIINTIDKKQVLDPEQAYFTFPFDIPDGQARIDIPWGVVRPETDQMAGANRNFFTVQRWVDISGKDGGVTWVTLDAPMVKFDPLRIIGKGRGDSYAMAEFGEGGIRSWWNTSALPSSTFYSWILTNHWEVNYKAYQEGEITFHYVLIPHEKVYDGAEAERNAREVSQPLIAVEADPSGAVSEPYFSVSSDEVIVTSVRPANDGAGQMIRLYNPQPGSRTAEIVFNVPGEYGIHYCNSMGDALSPAANPFDLPGYGVATLRIDRKKSTGS
jgi:alpha-mannosidase